jgi:phage baseplate assembly protein V
MDILARLTELERRLMNVVMLGQIMAIDAEHHQVQVKLSFESPWLPWLTHRAGRDTTFWAPDVGEQVLILCPQGNVALGVVLPALYQNRFPAPTTDPNQYHLHFSDGAHICYDKTTHQLTMTLPAAGQLNITAPGGINLTGNLTVTGDISASQTIGDGIRSMDQDRRLYNQHTHLSPESGAHTSPPENSQ